MCVDTQRETSTEMNSSNISKRSYTLYFTKNTKEDLIKLEMFFNKKNDKDNIDYVLDFIDNKKIKIIKNKYEVLKIASKYGLAVINLKSDFLDLENQFDGKIYKSNVKHILNESITLNVYKINKKIKIKNSITVYGFIDTTNKNMLILINRQYFENDKKIVRTNCILISDA